MKRFAMSGIVVAFGVLTMGGAALVAQSSTITAAEQANLKFVLDWWREVLQGRHLDLAPKYQAENYIQHNPNVPTGPRRSSSSSARFASPSRSSLNGRTSRR